MSNKLKNRMDSKNTIKLTTMKKLMLSVFALAAVVFSANAVEGVNTATLGGSSHATLQAPISIVAGTNTDVDKNGKEVKDGSNLNFGLININSAGGTVTVGIDNEWASSTTEITEAATSTHNAAGFKVGGTSGLTYTVSVPTSTSLTCSASTGTPLTISTFTNSASGTIEASASNTFLVGATITIPANAHVGAYSGTFDVKVLYN